MTGPTQTIYAETQALYNAASAWRDVVSPAIGEAQQLASNGEGQGYLFGVALAELQEPHNDFAEMSASVLGGGKSTTQEFGEAIEKAAKNFEATDAQRATLLTKEEAGIP
ncbi:MAG: hypothetical protein V9G04_03045 [Nocardioides sp.]|jgi:hypothetical protein